MNTDMQRVRLSLLARGLVIGAFAASGFATAAAIPEIEPNDSIGTAQPVSVPTEGLSISGVLGQIGGPNNIDVDFFSFQGTQGDTPGITTVGSCPGFPANIGLFDAAGNLVASASGDCSLPTEALLNNYTLLATGTYTVGVSAWTHTFSINGGVPDNMDMPTPGGTYQLVINRVRDSSPAPVPVPVPAPTPVPVPGPTSVPTLPPLSSATHVPIEIRHWQNDDRELGKRNGRDPITVVIFSMANFDAMTVDANSLTFGATGKEKSLFRCRKEGRDVNRDGLLDMVCYFKPDVANFQPGDLNGVLMGKAKVGQANVGIEGSAGLKIFTRKTDRGNFKHRDEDGQKAGKDNRRN